ncbi:MAG: bifunctional hydroxymethylpyrimidine kinase/phosphomethylpyrimidine kinase [Bacteroidia bacterium]|jgi:sugar/nucleoside kinase (ribokinase family)|nr:bifunctional hydroxymethylpyrimidine kinase/phosphomethylpyrimidine kinase [Bacteroidia bacterium]MCO5252980.1 PfkB family carbohydrate kinase [Bacteroidota bacterium]
MSLLIIGSVAFDAIETPFGKTDKIIGGAASYIALSSSYFINPVNLVAVVGGDFPHEYITQLQSRRINTKGLQIKKDEKSFFWSGRYNYDLNSRDTLVTELNVLEKFDPIIPESYQDCEYLMLGNLSPEVQLQVIERLHKRPKLIVLDTMNFWMDIALDSLKKIISKVDVLTINDEEARQLSGEYQLKKAAQKIMQNGLKYLIIKKGEHGAILFHEDKSFYVPAFLLDQVFDPTGAGDTFAGGFIGYIAKTGNTNFETLKRALVYGSAMASFCVEKFGTDNLFNLSEEQIEDRYNQFRFMVEF